ncbi:MAG: phosphatase PAP2-related protein [bacterium]
MYFSNVSKEWKSCFANKHFRVRFFITIFLLVVVLLSLSNFLQYNETREGFSFTDPILLYFNPVDVTWITFLFIYLSLIIGIGYLLQHPNQLMIAIQSYALLVVIRICVMYSLPLNPPAGLIPLNDPFVQFFGSGQILEKDLFFSGHTATILLLFLVSKNKILKMVFLLATMIIAICVLLQHVHYIIDVLAAPFFTYASYRIITLMNKKFLKN